jgi:hypothetical protein
MSRVLAILIKRILLSANPLIVIRFFALFHTHTDILAFAYLDKVLHRLLLLCHPDLSDIDEQLKVVYFLLLCAINQDVYIYTVKPIWRLLNYFSRLLKLQHLLLIRLFKNFVSVQLMQLVE